MMNKFIYALLFFVPILHLSCHQRQIQSEYRILTEFPQTLTLENGDTCTVFDSDYGLLDLATAGDYLIGTLRKRDYFFSLYTTDSVPQLLGVFGTSGKGPAEMMAPAYSGQWSKENDQTKIWILDRVKAEFIKINLDSTLDYGRTIIEQRYDLNTETLPDVRNLFFVNDTSLIGTAESYDCPLFRYNPQTATLVYLPTAQQFPEELSRQALQEISQNLCTYNPAKHTIVSSFFAFPQIEFRHTDSLRFHTVFINRILTPESCLAMPRMTYYASICSTDEYIYALWLDQMDDDFGEITKPISVQIYDWNGNPIAQLNLPNYTLSICVDPIHHKLYTLNYYQEINSVIVYDLNPIQISHEN